jgi:hypothetical protein
MIWKKNDDVYKARLEKAFEPFFIELEGLGVDRSFSESLLFFGREFVASVREEVDKKKSEDLTDDELEETWGARPNKLTDKEIREAKLAEKSGAETWVSLPMKGDKVGINILTYKKR